MNAEIRQIRTAAEQGLVDAYAAAKDSLPGNRAVADLRAEAFRLFEAKGLPHRRVEEWKYTDLRALLRDARPLASRPDREAGAVARDAGRMFGSAQPRRIVIADGAFMRELSDLAELEPGIEIGSLADALREPDPAMLRRLSSGGLAGSDVAVALNTALMGDGAVIRIARGMSARRPLHLVFVTTGRAGSAVFSRSFVDIGPGAAITLLESHEGPNGADHHVNHAIDLAIGDGARVDHIKFVDEGDRTVHVGSLMAHVGAKADVRFFAFNIGGAVARNQLWMRLDGEHTQAAIGGVMVQRGRQHADMTLVVDHARGHCQSRELFKTVLDQESRGVFQGKIIVQPDAQKTDGRMASHALLLSEEAEADHKPELEIFADDVQCGHGATAGALNRDLLFYLKARGIPSREAEALLIQAFVGEALEMVRNDDVRDVLTALASAWLAARGGHA